MRHKQKSQELCERDGFFGKMGNSHLLAVAANTSALWRQFRISHLVSRRHLALCVAAPLATRLRPEDKSGRVKSTAKSLSHNSKLAVVVCLPHKNPDNNLQLRLEASRLCSTARRLNIVPVNNGLQTQNQAFSF